jgi:hypothetical protein
MMHILLGGLVLVGDPGAQLYELASPCMPGPVGSAMLKDDGLILRDADRHSGDRGELFEFWRSASGDKWAAVVYLADENVRCLVASRLVDYGA